MEKDDMFICGDYVLSPHADDVKPENIAKNFSGYITLFDETLERISND